MDGIIIYLGIGVLFALSMGGRGCLGQLPFIIGWPLVVIMLILRAFID